MRNKFIIFGAAVLFIISFIAGCGDRNAGEGKKIIVKIGKYEMTADEFKDEAKLVAPNQYLAQDQDAAKAELLDEIVIRKILIQEAQKENFDKDKAFMKEIERYWEQALIKLLVKKKMLEIYRGITVGTDTERQEKLQQEFNDWIAQLKNKASVKVYDKNLKEITLE